MATATKTRAAAPTTAKRHSSRKPAAPMTADEWYSVALTALIKRAAKGKPFTMYDLVLLDGLQDQPHRNGFQALTRRAVSAHIISRHAVVHSARPATRGSFVSQWIGVGKASYGTAA